MASIFINADGLLQITGPTQITLGNLITQLFTLLMTFNTIGSPVAQTINPTLVTSLTALQAQFQQMLL